MVTVDMENVDLKQMRMQASSKRRKLSKNNPKSSLNNQYLNNPVILKACDITKSFKMGQSHLRVLKGIELSVKKGEFLSVTGASGSGKSTLMHILSGLDRPDTGMVEFKGDNIADFSAGKLDRFRNKNIGFVFQFYHLIEELTVIENILLPAMACSGIIRWFGSAAKKRKKAEQLLELIGLSDRAEQKSYQLSGGERQRVAIARALINDPEIIFADEPTGNLDSETGSTVLQLFEDLNNTGQTIIMVTHDEIIAKIAHRCIRLIDGKIQRQ